MGWERATVSRAGELETQLLEMGAMVCARHLLPAGFDSAPLYRGLPDDMCPCEHWCYLARGRLRYRFADALEDAELIEFTAAEDYRRKAGHLARRPPA